MTAPAAPLVSVIMPAHNAEPFLEAAARSVFEQTYVDWELIVIDDGSTDRTPAVADIVRRRDPNRVKVVTTTNRGPAAARNAGIGVSNGECFALLDSDDLWEPRFLESQMKILDSRPDLDLVTGNARNLGGRRHGRPVRPYPDRRPGITLATIVIDEEAVFIMTVFRRRVLDVLGGFDETLRANEDFELWLRAALDGFRFTRNDRPLGWYRRHPASISADAIRMLRGALHVCVRARPLFEARPERDLLERQIAHYQAELEQAQARAALAAGDWQGAARALLALHARRPSLRTAAAAQLARRAAPLLPALYQLKRRVLDCRTSLADWP